MQQFGAETTGPPTASTLSRLQYNGFLSPLVTDDDTWVYHCIPESKMESILWKHSTSTVKMKFEVTTNAEKVRWNIRGGILVHFTPRGVSVTTVACQAPLQDLVEAIRLQGPGVLTRRVLLIYNNARPYTARCTIALPDIWLWERVPRPQCSLDLTPSNFYVFDERKKTFPRSDDTVKAEAQKCLREQDVSFYRQSSQNVILH